MKDRSLLISLMASGLSRGSGAEMMAPLMFFMLLLLESGCGPGIVLLPRDQPPQEMLYYGLCECHLCKVAWQGTYCAPPNKEYHDTRRMYVCAEKRSDMTSTTIANLKSALDSKCLAVQEGLNFDSVTGVRKNSFRCSTVTGISTQMPDFVTDVEGKVCTTSTTTSNAYSDGYLLSLKGDVHSSNSSLEIEVNGTPITIPLEGLAYFKDGFCYPGTGIPGCTLGLDSMVLRSPAGFSFTVSGETVQNIMLSNAYPYHGEVDGQGNGILIGDPNSRLFSVAYNLQRERYYFNEATDNNALAVQFDYPGRALYVTGVINTDYGPGILNIVAEVDNYFPYANAGGHQFVQCTSQDGAWVQLNGLGIDPDFENWDYVGWFEDVGTQHSLIANGFIPTVYLSIGVHYLMLYVRDDNGGFNVAHTVVTVEEPCQ